MRPSRIQFTFPPSIDIYVREAAVAEDKTITEVIIESIRLRRKLREGDVYILENNRMVKLVIP